jgi:hypothetical protein
MKMNDNIFSKLNAINVNDKTEKKNGLTYLSWAWAWGEVKKLYPDATYTIYENTLPSGYVVNYFTDGRTSYVKTGVTINNLEHIEELPVMDYRNKSILLENMTSFDVNKTIQRSLTKALARHGLGLYIYAGEDLPEDEKDNELEKVIDKTKVQALNKSIENAGITDEVVELILSQYGYTSTSEIKVKDYANLVNDFKSKVKE